MPTLTQEHRIVSHEEWLRAQRDHLQREKEFTRFRDELSRERRALPWLKVDKDYVFEGPNGPQKLADLFDGRSQLVVYHFMFGPDWEQGCPNCSFMADHFDGMLPHLTHRDVTLVAISRAPYAQIAPFKQRMGWQFPWVSSFGTDFNHDFHASPTKEEQAARSMFYNFQQSPTHGMTDLHALSVFYKDQSGDIFLTFASFARGTEFLLSTYNYLDIVPKGRDEDGYDFPLAWVRHHDRYGADYRVDPKAGYDHPKIVDSCCHPAAEADHP